MASVAPTTSGSYFLWVAERNPAGGLVRVRVRRMTLLGPDTFLGPSTNLGPIVTA